MLWKVLDACHAYEALHDPQVAGALNSEQYLDLALKAGYHEEAAQRAATRRANDRLALELPP